jgi:hypothetical protein
MLNKKQIIEVKNPDKNNQYFKKLYESGKTDEKEPHKLEIRNTEDIIYSIHYLLNTLEKSILYDEMKDFETIYKLAKD